MIESWAGHTPQIDPEAFVHPGAHLIGEVALAAHVSVWPTVVLRGDMGPIRIGAWSNLQDGAICHDTTGLSETLVGERVTVGHRAILHGCVVRDDSLIGMGAIVMDNAVVGPGSMVAAGSVVPPNKVVPPGMMWVGGALRPLRDRDREMIETGWRTYAGKCAEWLALGAGAPGPR